MTTALQIITDAAKLLGVVRKGEALDADEADDGLRALNDMLASWSTSSLSLLARYRESFTLTANAEHTIGTGMTFDTVAPTKIVQAFIRSGDIDYPLTIITDEEYEDIAFKGLQGDIPRYLNYSKSPSTASGTIRLYPVPTTANTLHLLSEKAFTEVSSLSDTVFLPQAGANRAVKFNLAIDIAPTFSVEPSPYVAKAAGESLGAIKIEAARLRTMAYNPSDGQQGNIYTGWR